MRHHPLGRTGLFVSELCLGTMTFGGSGGMWSKIGDLQQAEAERLVGQAVDAGINFIDTADVYSGGLSEQITGQALKNLKVPREQRGRRDQGVRRDRRRPERSAALTRSHILDGVKASLKRLQLDHIDLYQIHGFDPATPIEETLRALDQLVRHGHVRYVGVSNWAAWQIAKALGISERLGLARFESLQAYYTRRRPRPGARAGSDAAQRRRGPDGVEPAGRRPAQRQVRPRPAAAERQGEPPHARSTFRRWTRTAPATASTRCARWPRRAACRWRRSRWPGCCTSRRSPA